MSTIVPCGNVQDHEEKIEMLEHTVDSLRKTVDDLQRSQGEKFQQFEGRFQKLEAIHSGPIKLQPKESRGNA